MNQSRIALFPGAAEEFPSLKKNRITKPSVIQHDTDFYVTAFSTKYLQVRPKLQTRVFAIGFRLSAIF